MDARIAELETAPAREARWEYRPTGRNYRDAWEACDGLDERRALLARSEITVAVHKLGFDLRVPEEIGM